jgi:hypothetical protein
MSDNYPILEESTWNPEKHEWTHTKCGTILLSAPVSHSIHNGAGSLAGFGEVATARVPYCPTCESKPSPNGAPLRQNPVDVREADILRRMRQTRG